MGQARQRGRRFLERLRQALPAGNAQTLDAAAFVFGQPADLQQTVDKKAQPELGRQPPSRSMWRVEQPSSSRSAITLRIVAGDKFWPRRRDRVREPIGSPVATYPSTIRRKISRLRSLSSVIGEGTRGRGMRNHV